MAGFVRQEQTFQKAMEAMNPAADDFVPQVVSLILQTARSARASDIHLIPQPSVLLMQWRIDGVLQTVSAFDRELANRKLAIRPGQPLAFGKIQGKLAFGLPGNPVSSMVTFEQLVRPAMLKLSGARGYGRPLLEAEFQEKFSKRTDRRHFLRGVLWREDGVFKVRTTGDQGSGILTSMVKANCLIDIPVEADRVNPGDLVTVQLLSGSVCLEQAAPISSAAHRPSCC